MMEVEVELLVEMLVEWFVAHTQTILSLFHCEKDHVDQHQEFFEFLQISANSIHRLHEDVH